MESKQALTYAILLQTFEVSAHEAMQRRLLMRNVLDQIELAPLIVLERHIVLGVNSVHLTFSLGVSK